MTVSYNPNMDVSKVEFVKEDNLIYLKGEVTIKDVTDDNHKHENITQKIANIKTHNIDEFKLYEFDLRPFNGELIKVYIEHQNNSIMRDFMKSVFCDYYHQRKYVYEGEIWDKIKKLGLVNIDIDYEESVAGSSSRYYMEDIRGNFENGKIYINVDCDDWNRSYYILHIKDFVNINFELLSKNQLDRLNNMYLYNSDYPVFGKRLASKINKYIKIDEIDKLKILNNFLKYRINASRKHKEHVFLHM